jgi:DNA polymerase V
MAFSLTFFVLLYYFARISLPRGVFTPKFLRIMTKSRVVATRARPDVANRLTTTNLSRDEIGLELNPGYLDDPEITIIIRMEQPGFEDLRVSLGDLVIGDRRVTPGDGSLVIAMAGGKMVVRRFSISEGGAFLCAGAGTRGRTKITDTGQTEILATVVSVIPVAPD